MREELRRQARRLLGLVAVLEILLHRGGQGAAMGLRLQSEGTLLRFLTEAGDAVGPRLQTALLLAAALVTGTELASFRAADGRLRLLLLVLAAATAAWCLTWMVAFPKEPPPPRLLGVPVFVGAATLLALRSAPSSSRLGSVLAALGAALCSLWFFAVREGDPTAGISRAIEAAGEGLLLGGIGIVALLGRPWRRPAPTPSLILGIGVAALVLAVFLSLPEAADHIVGHVFHLRETLIPHFVFGVLVAAAIGRIAALGAGGPRALAIALFLTLASARGPGVELLALRAAAAVLLASAAMPPARERAPPPAAGIG